MLKRLFTPLTLVNQLALIVLLSTAIGVAGIGISARLVHGVQGSAHAINKAGSLRMQSYRLLAAIPLTEGDSKLLDDMNATVFSEELQNAALRDGQDSQLKALQQYWQLELAPGMKHAQNQATVATDVASFVDRIDHLVTSFDHTTEQRIRYVVWLQRVMAIGMALLFLFTIVWLRAVCYARGNSCWPWPGRSAIVILPNASISAAAMRWPASVWRLTTCQKSWRKAIRYSNDEYRKKPPAWSRKMKSSPFCGRPTVVCTPAPRFVNVFHRCSTACRG